MIAIYIVLYAGAPIRLPSLDLATPERASQFISTADAWFEVYRASLNPAHCRVVPVSEVLHDVQPIAAQNFGGVR